MMTDPAEIQTVDVK